MLSWFKSLDRVLRGEATHPSALRRGNIEIPTFGLCVVIVVLAVIYGACMGCYSLFREMAPAHEGEPVYMQLIASTVKVPALFTLTLLVTFPSLYVFNALVGSRLTLLPVLRLLIASLGVNLAVLSSLGPIVAFFSVNTTSYPFMILLNVAVFGVAGILGLVFLLQTLNRLTAARWEPDAGHVASAAAEKPREPEARDDGPIPFDEASAEDTPAVDALASQAVAAEILPATGPSEPEPIAPASPLDRIKGHVLGRHVRSVFVCWMVVFGLVGAQMGWILRPFIGSPDAPFEWFRQRDSNFFEAVWQAIMSLVSGMG